MKEMPVYKERSALTGMQVSEAMQKIVYRLRESASITKCIRVMIRMKSNIILIDNSAGLPSGVITKTDLMNAFYAGIPIETSVADIMAGPLLFCHPDDRLEDVIDIMHRDGVHRIFVRGNDEHAIKGTLEYSDIVGLLYRYCRTCEKSRWKTANTVEINPLNLKVKDAMIEDAPACGVEHSITEVIDSLAGTGFGAALLYDENLQPAGVISKTDIIIAFLHNISPEMPAGKIMTTPVAYCLADTMLTDAIQQMYLLDIEQLFVKSPNRDAVGGQLTISRAAHYRSGTCKACIASLMLEKL